MTTPDSSTAPPPFGAAPFCLPQILDLSQADGLQAELESRVAQDRSLRMDGGRVERVSTACLQVLAAAALACRSGGGSFTVETPSPALRLAIQDLGLAPLLATDLS
jgi:anti-anti-sigma regulatory factor